MQGLTHGDPHAHVGAYDRDGGVLLGEGKLTTIDNQVDASTGTIRMRAEFINKDGKLWPGQFVTVRLQTGSERQRARRAGAHRAPGFARALCFPSA